MLHSLWCSIYVRDDPFEARAADFFTGKIILRGVELNLLTFFLAPARKDVNDYIYPSLRSASAIMLTNLDLLFQETT